MASDPAVQGGDKRRSQRVGAPKVVVRIPSADRLRSHYLKDLSEGGLFIRADRTFPTGTSLTIELWPPGGVPALTLPARITRVTEPAAAQPGHPAGMGVSFVGLSAETEVRLRGLITEHGRPVFDPSEGDPLSQLQSLVAELDETRDQLSALSAEMAEARGQAEAYSDQVRKLELENQKLRADLQASQVRDRDLGRALSEAGKRVATGKHKPAAKASPSGSSAIPSPSPRSEPPVEIVLPQAPRPPPPPPPPPPEVTDSVDLAFDALISGADSSTDGDEPLVDEPLFRDEQEIDLEIDATPQGRPQPPAHDDALSSFLSVDQGTLRKHESPSPPPPPPPVVGGMAGFVLESSIAEGRVGYEQFSKKIKLTTRLMPTEALENRKPGNADEAMLSELLSASPTFETLLNQMGGQMKDMRLRQMLYELYARALVDLREG